MAGQPNSASVESERVLKKVVHQDDSALKRTQEALRDSENRYRELIDLAVDGILIGSHEGVIMEANRCMCELAGMPRDAIVGRNIRDVLFSPDSLEAVPLRFDLLQQGETVVSERQIVRADGSRIFIEMRSKMMPDGCYQSIYRDITERKTTESSLYNFAETLADRVEARTRELETVNASLNSHLQELRVSQALLSEMGRMAKVGGWELDLQTGKQVWTDEVYAIHEVELDFEPTAENGVMFYAPVFRPAIQDAVRRCIEFGEPFDLELKFITARGNERWVHSVGKADHQHGRIQGTFQDVTERRLIDDALREKNAALDHSVAQLRKLAMELTQTEERERKRLAAILHDNVQQYIAAARMRISLLDGALTPEELTEGVSNALSLLGEALEASRSLTVSLCPPVLLEAGLMPGLQWLAEWMHDKHGLVVKITGGCSVIVPGPLCTFLFQAVRELLFNTVKHAGVKHASVALLQPDGMTLRVIVSDRGKGFSADESSPSQSSGGFGLFHLRERLVYMGGDFEVISSPGHGVRIMMTLPL